MPKVLAFCKKCVSTKLSEKWQLGIRSVIVCDLMQDPRSSCMKMHYLTSDNYGYCYYCALSSCKWQESFVYKYVWKVSNMWCSYEHYCLWPYIMQTASNSCPQIRLPEKCQIVWHHYKRCTFSTVILQSTRSSFDKGLSDNR